LENTEYEIAYQWLDGDNMAADKNVVACIDLEITPKLEREWISREISRFLNQMRKDADYNVADKVVMHYDTKDKLLEEVIMEFSNFFKAEALLKDVKKNSKPEWDIVALFNYKEKPVTFSLTK